MRRGTACLPEGRDKVETAEAGHFRHLADIRIQIRFNVDGQPVQRCPAQSARLRLAMSFTQGGKKDGGDLGAQRFGVFRTGMQRGGVDIRCPRPGAGIFMDQPGVTPHRVIRYCRVFRRLRPFPRIQFKRQPVGSDLGGMRMRQARRHVFHCARRPCTGLQIQAVERFVAEPGAQSYANGMGRRRNNTRLSMGQALRQGQFHQGFPSCSKNQRNFLKAPLSSVSLCLAEANRGNIDGIEAYRQ